MEIKWEIQALIIFGVLTIITWASYGYKQKKLIISPILKRNNHDPLAVSSILPLKHFVALRLIFTIYAWTAMIYDSIRYFPQTFSFYTVWNYTALIFYFTSATTFSMITLFFPRGVSDRKCSNYLRVITWIVFQTECALALLVDLTVWLILVPGSDHPLQFLNYNSVSMHMLNFVFLMTDLWLNELPFLFHYGFFVLVAGICYVMWSWIYYDFLDGEWDYFFLDTTKEINAVWQSIVFILHLLSWCIVFKFAQFRDNIKAKKQKQEKVYALLEDTNRDKNIESDDKKHNDQDAVSFVGVQIEEQ